MINSIDSTHLKKRIGTIYIRAPQTLLQSRVIRKMVYNFMHKASSTRR